MEFTRRTGLFAAAAAVVLTATACSSTTSDPASGSGAASGGSFPVKVKHIYGETEIPKQPTRVASITWVNADVALALGVVPVGMALDTWGQNKNNSTDWKDAKLEELGAAIGTDKAPVQYDETDGVNFEEIAKVQPDLIIAAYSGLTKEEYEKLSKIAPVVGPVAANYTSSWEDATTAIGQALGKDAEAKKLIEDVTAKLDAVPAKNPILKDTTFIAANLEPETSGINIYTSGDNRPRLLTALGLTEAPFVEKHATGDGFFYNWSAERGDELASDIFYTWLPDGMTAADIKSDPLLGQIPGVKDGGLLASNDTALSLAVSASSPLSLPWALDEFVPDLVKAAEAARASKS